METTETTLRKELGLGDLVLFNLAALISTRWISVAAHVGPGAIVLWLLAAALFLLPCAFVVANLSRRFPEQGGLYVWTREAFGEWHGFACAWFYYLNNLFWIPGVLISLVGMTTFAFSERLGHLAENPYYVLPCAMALLIAIIAVNYVGLGIAKWVDNFGGISVYVIASILLIAGAAAWWRHGSATKFYFWPHWDLKKMNFWSQMAMGMTGLELSPILSGEIRNPRRNIMRATWISALLVALFYVGSTGSILIFLDPDKVSPVIGLAQASRQASALLGWRWVPLAIAVAILLSAGGQLGTYVGACARLPFVLGIGNMLPPAFAKLHPKYGTPFISILFLGAGSAFLLVISQLGETFRGAYQFTVDLTVVSLFVPFLYIFAAAWKFGQRIAGVCGLFVSTIAIAFSFLPTPDIRSVFWFETKLIGGCILLFVLAHWCYRHYRPDHNPIHSEHPMQNTIDQYREAKAAYQKLHNQAKKELIARFNQLAVELFQIQKELKEDFGHKVTIPAKGKVTRGVRPQASKPAEPPAAPNPKIATLEKRLAAEKLKLEKAGTAGKPDKLIKDRIYELEDELRLLREA